MNKSLVLCLACSLGGLIPPEAAAQKKEDIPIIVKKLKSPFASEVVSAARDLEKLGPDARSAVPDLAEALRKARFVEETQAIAKALGRMGPAARDAVPALAEMLKKVPFIGQRQAIMDALEQIGPAAQAAIPALNELARTGFLEERQKATALIKKIQSREGRIGIRDDGKFFGAESIKKASDEILDIVGKYDMDLRIETYAAPPANQAARVRAMSANDRGKFFHGWALERVDAAAIHGVYILVCKDPGHIHVVIAPKFRAVFDDRSRDKLRDLIVEDFKAKHFNEGLLTGIAFIRGRLAAAPSR
jgi:hypothetical protein